MNAEFFANTFIIAAWLFSAMMQAARSSEFKARGDRGGMWSRMLLCFVMCITAALYIMNIIRKHQ